jgi:integrase
MSGFWTEVLGATGAIKAIETIETIGALGAMKAIEAIAKIGRRRFVAFDELARNYFAENAHTANAAALLARYEKHIAPVLGGLNARAIGRGDLLAFYHAKSKAKKRNGQRYSKAFCKSLLDIIGASYSRELSREGSRAAANPMAGFYAAHPKISRLENEKERTFTQGEVEAILLEAARTDAAAWRFIALAIVTGARRGAILRVRRRDVDLGAKIIRLIDEKSDRRYQIPLCAAACDGFDGFLSAIKGEDFAVWGDANARSRNMINYFVQRIIDRVVAGNGEAERNARLTLHSFRSFAICAILRAGCPEPLARRFSNHSSDRRSAFERYVKANVEDLRPYAEKAFGFLREF